MSFNDPSLAHVLDSEYVDLCILFKIEFASETMYLAMQNVGFTDLNGQEWRAANSSIISFDDFPLGAKATAQKRTYNVALPDTATSNRLISMESEYRGRRITQLIQFFTPDRTPILTPQFLATHIMDLAKPIVDAKGQASISLDCEGLFTGKNFSPNGLLTDTDQKARHAGDEGLNWVKALQRGVVLEIPPA
tara:strand:- start:540 stop:1115 length:576 start_codon:yes stop_codon:yes gene_type:complete